MRYRPMTVWCIPCSSTTKATAVATDHGQTFEIRVTPFTVFGCKGKGVACNTVIVYSEHYCFEHSPPRDINLNK